jgi:PAS domain S-box-containing protein
MSVPVETHDAGTRGFAPFRPEIHADLDADPFHLVFQWSGICMARLDEGSRLTEANSDFLRQFGRTAGEVVDRPFRELVHPAVAEHVQRKLTALLHGRRIRVRQHIVGLCPDGSTFSAVLTAIAEGDDSASNRIIAMVQPEKITGEPERVAKRDKLLTELDARILEGVAVGTSSVKLASSLYLSRQGVEYHVGGMLRKFKAPNRPALVSRAYSLGILSVGSWPPRVLPDYIK